ncbi:hypothetical protein POPTR_011G162101v4 [Populus trichocarpa]|uniref:Uncharacterized protein n=1 Tax=Populus trichocarpa TaxID=3694 RepID=A0ACC0S9E9_POPTR|nr:hypothetical protein POPTR_011G162101v4 [Populus trichocarpa]
MLANSSGHPACHCEERSALLQFKESFILSRSASKFPFAYPKVESSKLDGNGSDCCLWDGVECDEDTGHVIELDSTLVVSMVPLTPTGLWLLNLSNNIFSGFIPSSIGNLAKLEALDLSQNKLSGNIPKQLVQLTFLQFFNASHNHLTGPIPRGNQFNTFQKDSFDGNSGLSGEPLSNKCGSLKALPAPAPATGDELLGLDWKFVLIGYGSGFVIGAAIGHFVTKRKHDWLETFRIQRESHNKFNGPDFSNLYIFLTATTTFFSHFLPAKHKHRQTKTKTPQLWSGCGGFLLFKEKKGRNPLKIKLHN